MTTAAAPPLPAPPAGAQELAVLLSAAVRIEPQLVRAVRLFLLPELDVGAESDLWFSDWVSGRTSELITLDPAVRPYLYQRLSGWLRDQAPAAGERLRGQIRRVHAEISPALQVEEEALWLALTGGTEDEINAVLALALQALVAQGRAGVAEWYLSAWPRLPGPARRTRGAWQLAQVAVQHRAVAPPLTVETPPELTVGDLTPVAGALPEVPLGIRRAGPDLWLGDLPEATAQIMVPDTDPRVIEITGAVTQTVFVGRGAAAHVTVGEAAVVLRTGLGTAYQLPGLADISLQAPDAEVRRGPALRLRLSCRSDEADYLVDLTLEEDSAAQEATVRLGFHLSAQDREDLRWYLEDYLETPVEPTPSIAARVEGGLAELGTELFRRIFEGNRDSSPLWDRVARGLSDTRVEIVADSQSTVAIPWELLRDPAANRAVALEASSFVHCPPAAPVIVPESTPGPLRVLLVISRPGGAEDVPYHSVAGPLWELSRRAPDALQLDVLRPPTFARLTQVLEEAHASGVPYRMVHFDGHGAYLEEGRALVGAPMMYRRDVFAVVVRPGPRGVLIFEGPGRESNQELVNGRALGQLLARTGVPVLLMNACRTAHAEPRAAPDTVTGESRGAGEAASYESLAAEIVDAGLAGVVAMRYNVYVVTAVLFMSELYPALLASQTLGEAVAAARRRLSAYTRREVAGQDLSLQDWMVPVVYEAAPLILYAPQSAESRLSLALDPAEAERVALRSGLPREPDTGFVGRDETLFALDRAFDSARVLLLHGWAGAGKTATAVQFADWYAGTGGVGAVLFSSFENHLPLTRLLDQLGDRFGPMLARSGVQWVVLDDVQRRGLALQILRQIPLLWVWDGVQPVAGFPVGAPSDWTDTEQSDLARFLRDLAETRCKVLLTSRREEREWLSDLPVRVDMPPMRVPDRLDLARAVAARQLGSRGVVDLAGWRLLLEFTQGNPLTVLVLVRQAIREHLTTAEEIRGFVERLRAGAEHGPDQDDQGRTSSLTASLDYGFNRAFTEAERAILALLALFQGFVEVEALLIMGDPGAGAQPVPTAAGLTRDTLLALLDRAADVGLLTARGDGFYAVHPAVPWYLQNLFAQHYGPPGNPPAGQARQAWTAALSQLGSRYAEQHRLGRGEVLAVLAAEEANLLRAAGLAIDNDWYSLVLGPVRGLNVLYGYIGRATEWRRLVAGLAPIVTDLSTGGTLPGREPQWAAITEYQIDIAIKARDWPVAVRLLDITIAWRREQAARALAIPPPERSDDHRTRVRDLAVSMGQSASALLAQADPGCVLRYQEALELFGQVGASREEATVAVGLGDAYLNVPGLRDLDQAERWYQRSLDLFESQDPLGRARSMARLGEVAYERFLDNKAAATSPDRLGQLLNEALERSNHALELMPAEAPADLARIFRQIGTVYREAGEIERSLVNYQRAIQYEERQDDSYGAGQTRYGAALALARAGRLADALLYARAALQDYLRTGPGAAADAEQAHELIARLERGETEPERPPTTGYYVAEAIWPHQALGR